MHLCSGICLAICQIIQNDFAYWRLPVYIKLKIRITQVFTKLWTSENNTLFFGLLTTVKPYSQYLNACQRHFPTAKNMYLWYYANPINVFFFNGYGNKCVYPFWTTLIRRIPSAYSHPPTQSSIFLLFFFAFDVALLLSRPLHQRLVAIPSFSPLQSYHFWWLRRARDGVVYGAALPVMPERFGGVDRGVPSLPARLGPVVYGVSPAPSEVRRQAGTLIATVWFGPTQGRCWLIGSRELV